MLTKNIKFKNFLVKSKNLKIKKIFKNLKKNFLLGNEKLLLSLSENYQYSFDKKLINKHKKFFNFRLIGMGGSILGAEAIYQFLKHKIKKNFFFFSNLENKLNLKKNKKNTVNLVISKSGNTLETIINSNILIKNNSTYTSKIEYLLSCNNFLESISAPHYIVYGHNDLLAANFLDDGKKLWLVDWEYSGFNDPMFDLGGLASNNNFQEKDEILLLEEYFEKNISDQQILKYNAMKTASLLRETMWSMVSEITSKIDFDYSEYTEQNLDKFESSFNSLKS